MASWKLLTDEEARGTWDRSLMRFDDCSPFQSYSWGEYRRALGWKPYHWAAFNEQGDVIAMMQGVVRRYPLGVGLVWSEGGPIGDLSVCDTNLQEAMKQTTGLKRIYCRFRCDRARHVHDALRLGAQGWSAPWSPLTSNYSMSLDLTQDEDRLLAACDQNWRRNLRRSKECNLRIREWQDPSVDEVLSVYVAMQDLKGLEEQHSREEIEQLLKNLKQQIILYRCDDEQGELVSLLGCVVVGNRACALFWATTERGRKIHASYAIFWALVQHCKNIGVISYDLAGIDPVRNPGVYRFKKATGATPIEYLGEWDWASKPWLRWFGNWAIARRRRIKQAESALKKSSVATASSQSESSSESLPRPKLADPRLHTALRIMKSSSDRFRLRRLATVLLFPILALSSGCIRNYAVTNDCTFAAHSPSVTSSMPEGMGVNIHFIDPQPGEMKMIADAGFRWVRMDFKWDATERERGSYDFSAYDRLMAALQPYNIRALFILDYGNPLYDDGAPPRSDTSREAFARWAVAAAKHFAGRGVIWEVYNEPNHSLFWPPRPNVREYIKLALAVGRAFNANVSNEKLVGPATSGIDFPFLEACFKAGLLDYWSAVTVHPYLRSDPELVASDYCRLRQMISQYRTPTSRDSDRVIPIISGEWGYSSVWRGMSEEKQGAMFARQTLTNVANGIPISIWYDWRDDGIEPSEPEHHFGLVRNADESSRDQTHEPKPAYLATVTLSGVFDGYKFERRVPVGNDNDYVLVFARANDIRLAAWTTSTIQHRIVIPLDPGEFITTKHTGERAGSVSAGPQGLAIDVSASPIYLTSRDQQ
jgi:hypothetical protein